MLYEHRIRFGVRHHAPRQMLTPAGPSPLDPDPAGTPTFPPIRTRTIHPIPSITTPDSTVTALPPSTVDPTIEPSITLHPSSEPDTALSSLVSSKQPPSTVLTTPPTTTSLPPQHALPSTLTSAFTSVMTLKSHSQAVTVTTIIKPTPSLSSASNTNKSFFDNKSQTGAVFGVVGLVVVAGIGFLAYRFKRSIQRKRADRETEEAARSAARVPVRLDDEDDDYGGSGPYGQNMAQLRPEPLSFFEFNDGNSGRLGGDGGAQHFGYLIPAHQQAPLGDDGVPEDGRVISMSERSISTNDSGEDLLQTRPESFGDVPTPQDSSGYLAVPNSKGGNLSGSFAPSRLLPSKKQETLYNPPQPPPPVLSLPRAFGEAKHLSVDMSTESHSDGHGRVLKIVNE